MVAQLDRLGATVSFLRYENRIQCRKVEIHGAVITSGPPVYLEQVAALQSLYRLHEWVEKHGGEIHKISQIGVTAGGIGARQAIDKWFT